MVDTLEQHQINHHRVRILAGDIDSETWFIYWNVRSGKTFSQARKDLEHLYSLSVNLTEANLLIQ